MSQEKFVVQIYPKNKSVNKMVYLVNHQIQVVVTVLKLLVEEIVDVALVVVIQILEELIIN